MKRDYAIYHVAFKILLKKANKVLFLKIANDKQLDLPGGRADNIENQTPLKTILAREVHEELGPKVKYKVGRLILQYRRYYKPRKIYILMTIYEAEYLSGEIKLSFEHSSYVWINPKTYEFSKKNFYSEEEYLTLKEYFSKL